MSGAKRRKRFLHSGGNAAEKVPAKMLGIWLQFSAFLAHGSSQRTRGAQARCMPRWSMHNVPTAPSPRTGGATGYRGLSTAHGGETAGCAAGAACTSNNGSDARGAGRGLELYDLPDSHIRFTYQVFRKMAHLSSGGPPLILTASHERRQVLENGILRPRCECADIVR